MNGEQARNGSAEAPRRPDDQAHAEASDRPDGGEATYGPRLTEEQRRRVRENVGLVAVHLRHCLGGIPVPRHDRGWEDLFQEGCLGLIRAAVEFREQRGIPFAAFALARIHWAVSESLRSRPAGVHVPRQRKRRRNPADDALHGRRPRHAHRADLRALLSPAAPQAADGRRCEPDEQPCETVGERLRGKYEQAARRTAEALAGQSGNRGDRDQLVRLLIEERFLVPQEDSRRALRQIARDTRSSYGRVAMCERQIAEVMRRELASDPEFLQLQRLARSDPLGVEAGVDESIEKELADAGAGEFLRRFREADTSTRARMLLTLLEVSAGDIEDLIRGRIRRLPAGARERLLRESAPGAS